MERPLLLLQHLFRCPWFGLISGSNGAWCMQRGWSFVHRQLHRFGFTNRSCEGIRFPFSSQLLGSHDPDTGYGLTDPTPGRKLTGLTGDEGERGSPDPSSGAKGQRARPLGCMHGQDMKTTCDTCRHAYASVHTAISMRGYEGM